MLVQRTTQVMNTNKTWPCLKAIDVYFRIVKMDFFFFYDKASKKDIAVCQDAKSQVTQVHNKSSCFIHFTWGYATEVQLIFESMNKYALINKIQQLCLISSHGLAQPTQTLRQ